MSIPTTPRKPPNKLFEAPPHGTKAETHSQVIGAFLMMHNVAPWEAQELLWWLDAEGFEIVRKSGTD